MSSLRASATIIVLRVLPRPSTVRALNHWARALSFWNLRKRQANWIITHRTERYRHAHFGIRTFRPTLRKAAEKLDGLQWSPRSQPRKARISSSVSRRSVFARRCSRDTPTLAGWMT
jgi:hypothetical protein